MDWVGRMICRALHIAVILLRINAEAQSLLSPRARDGHSADNLLRKRSCRPGHDERGSSIYSENHSWLRQNSTKAGMKGWIGLHRPDGEVVRIKTNQIVFVMSATNTGANTRALSRIQLLNGLRENVGEVMLGHPER
jgi:hypothetical protein